VDKKLITEFKTEISDQDLPLILHFALLYDAEVDVFSKPQMLKKSNAILKRYGTARYLPGNKFFKPISRTLDA
jgi:hypothetical protein